MRLHTYQEEDTTMATKESLMSVPSISLTTQLTIEKEENIEDNLSRGRSDRFLEQMKQNIPSPARISSPKSKNKKSHGNRNGSNHHSTHRTAPHSPSSPVLRRSHNRLESNNENEYENGFLSVATRPRPRSSSDSDMSKHRTDHVRRTRSNTNISLQKQIFTVGDEAISPLASPLASPFSSPARSPRDSPTLVRAKVNPEQTEGVTVTRRGLEIKECLSKHERECPKERTLRMIEALYTQCDDNLAEIESQINFTFVRLSTALNNRRAELLQKARNVCEQKKKSLDISREKCLKSETSLSRQCSLDESEVKLNGFHKECRNNRRGSVDEHDDILQHNGILEPWKSSQEANTSEQASADEEKDELPAKSENIFSEILEEGNLTFTFNEEVTETFHNIGKIEDGLSSPQFTVVKGLSKSFALTGDEVYFEIHTKNRKAESTFTNRDKLEVIASNSEGKTVDVVLQCLGRNNKKGFITNSNHATTHVALAHRFYAPYFSANEPGDYKISIFLNDVEVDASPIKYIVYPKMNLTFDTPGELKEEVVTSGFIHLNNIDTRRRSFIRRESSEDHDWQDSNWVVQKGDKSTLLQSSNDIPSCIYAANMVTGLCAWKLRVSSACASLTLSIGVGTRTGIPDIDEHYSCHFSVGNFEDESRNNDSFHYKMPMRRTSSFTRISLTYAVLLNTSDGTVRVVSEQNDEDKIVNINSDVLEKTPLFPFCAMVHHHKKCLMEVCPRPQIILL